MTRAFALILLAVVAICAGGWTHGIGLPQGGGPNLLVANEFSPPYGAPASSRTLDRAASSTADWTHTAGFTFIHPYDLRTMGSWGTGVEAAKGFRYLWILCPDHPGGFNGNDANQIYSAYSSDPAIFPDPSTMTPIIPADGGDSASAFPMVAHFLYNPDDATNPAYVYVEGINLNAGGQLHEILWKGPNLDGQLTFVGVSHANPTGSLTSYQTVYWLGTGNFISFGGANNAPGNVNGNLNGFWTSSNGATFTQTSTFVDTNGNSAWPNLNEMGLRGAAGGNTFVGVREEACSAPCNGANRVAQYVGFAPVSGTTGDLVTGGSPPITRVSAAYAGVYPGPSFLNSVSTYCEDGICLHQAVHGFYSDVPPGPPAPFPGIREQFVDRYYSIIDASAAMNAAPMGVRVSAAGGAVTLTWHDLNPNHTYRVYRSTSAGTQGSLLGNPTNGTFQDTPTASSSCTLYFYRVYALNGSTEEGFRTVSTFVSSSTEFVNKHITRACKGGADFATIDRSWLDTVDALLTTQNLHTALEHWANPAFGIAWNSGTGVISRVFDIGTTRLPRGGDFSPSNISTHTTTYSSTGFGSNGVPAWSNADTQAYGVWGTYGRGVTVNGRVNNVRFASGGGTLIASYKNPTAFQQTLINENLNGGFKLETTGGGSASFTVASFFGTWGASFTDTKPLTNGGGFNITGGTYDGTTVKVYVEGVAGSGAGPTPSTASPFFGVSVFNNAPVLSSGSDSLTFSYTANTVNGLYNFSGARAQLLVSDLILLNKSITPTQMAAITTAIRTRAGP